MPKERIEFGKKGETLAAEYLKKQGYRIVTLNYRSRLGEVDIIAKDKDVLCFIEVKSRKSDRFGLPEEAVTLRKQRQIAKAALSYLKENNLFGEKARFDVLAVLAGNEETKFNLIKDAFELSGGYNY